MRQSIATALLALALMTGAALAQQRTTYDARGNLVGRSATDSQGTTRRITIPEATSSAASSTSGNTTTVYDAGGRVICRRQ